MPKSEEQLAALNEQRQNLVSIYGENKVNKLESEARSVLSKAKLNIAVNSDVFSKIISEPDGRFKNFFEIDKSTKKAGYKATRLQD